MNFLTTPFRRNKRNVGNVLVKDNNFIQNLIIKSNSRILYSEVELDEVCNSPVKKKSNYNKRRSCLKLQCTEVNANKPEIRKKVHINEYHVHFDINHNQIHTIESPIVNSSDIWWSAKDIEEFHFNEINLLQHDDNIESVNAYIRACHIARTDLSTSFKYINNNSSTDSCKNTDNNKNAIQTKVRLQKDVYKSIVLGKSNGYAGSESCHCIFNDDEENEYSNKKLILPRRTIILLILQTFQKNKCKNHMNNKNINLEKNLRSYSRTLTTSDRSWGCIMGNANYDAIKIDF